MAFQAFRQKKPFDKMSQKCHFSPPLTRLLAPEGEIEKIAPGSLNSNISPDFHEKSKISAVSPRILVSL
jgi:hypothetical protein